MIMGFLQWRLATLDPLDSGFIINEQCVYLTSEYNLKMIKNIMLKRDFLQHLSNQISKMY